MVGSLVAIPGSFKFLLVAINNFTKWIEAKPVMNVEADTTIKFISSIIHRFRVGQNIITDNDTNFTGDTFREFCQNWSIQTYYFSVSHSQANR